MIVFADVLVARFPINRLVHMKLLLNNLLIEVLSDALVIGAGGSTRSLNRSHNWVVLLKKGSIPKSSPVGLDCGWSVAKPDSGIRVHKGDALN